MTWQRQDRGAVRRLAERQLRRSEVLEGAAFAYAFVPTWQHLAWSAVGTFLEGVLGAWPMDRAVGRSYVVARTADRLLVIACRPARKSRGAGDLEAEEVERLALADLRMEARRDVDNVTLQLEAGGARRFFFFNRHSMAGNVAEAEAVVRLYPRR